MRNLNFNGRVAGRARYIIIREHAKRGAFDIVVLAVLERPHECGEPGKSERKRHRDKIDEHVHVGFTLSLRNKSRAVRARGFARNELSVTSSEEPDMAMAAMSGVTKPAIAIGTATAL